MVFTGRSIYHQPDFLRLMLGSTSSGLATWGLVFLLGLAMTESLITATVLGITLGCRTGGFLVGVLLGGNLADRFGSRYVIFWASLLSAIGIVVIVFGMSWDNSYKLWLLTCGAALSGAGQGACRPAYQAFIPLVVKSDQRQTANATMSLSLNLAILAGPAITSMIALLISVPFTFVILIIIWLLSAISPPWRTEATPIAQQVTPHPLTILTDMREGLQEALLHRWFLASLVALTAIISTGYSATGVILPILSERHSNDAGLLTLAMTAYTVGGIIGSALMSRLSLQPSGWWALAGLACYGFVPIGLLAPDQVLLPMLAYMVAGIGIQTFNIIWFTAIQREVPREKLARVSSLDFLCSYGLAPLGLSVIAPLADYFGIQKVLIVCAITCFTAPLLASLVRSSKTYRSHIHEQETIANHSKVA